MMGDDYPFRPSANAFADAVIDAIRKRGRAEWIEGALILFERLCDRSLDINQLYLTDGWGCMDDDREDGNGEFTLQFFADSQADGYVAIGMICDVLNEMTEQEMLIVEHEDTSDLTAPWWWIRAMKR